MRAALTLAFALAALAPSARADDGACDGARCSGQGECFEENGAAHCLCDAGFAELGLTCVPSDTEDAVLRARHAPGAAERVVAAARAQVGRKRWQVGVGLEGFPGPLTDYLAPREWWCGDFVSWIYAGAGVPLSGGSAGGWLITDNRAIAAWHAQRDLFVDRSHPEWSTFTPRPGDFVRFRTDRYGHAAIVEDVVGDTLHLIEGNVSNAVARGTYYHWRRNRRIDGIGRMALDNAPPSVDAGRDVEVRLGEPLDLVGGVDDDGPREAIEARWTGPEGVWFDEPDAASTRARFAAAGTYALTLRVEDGEHAAVDRIVVRVIDPPPPAPPVAPPAPARAGCAATPASAPRAWPLGVLGLRLLARSRRRG
ncbi:MAG: CHAP domain-containing protein [Sandaracinaceae bacterium]|nr:CHAP domain-containing protein [Sandaracinaceae bacterium]